METTETLVTYFNLEEKLSSNNAAFISNDWLSVQIKLLRDYPTAVAVFSFFVQVADYKNTVIVSSTTIGKTLNLSNRTISRAITFLKNSKIIKVTKFGNMNRYILNDRLVWKGKPGTQKQFSEFSEDVVLALIKKESDSHADTKPVFDLFE